MKFHNFNIFYKVCIIFGLSSALTCRMESIQMGEVRLKATYLHVQGSPLHGLDPFGYTSKLTNGSDQHFMDPLNFTRQGMPKSFAELLTPKMVSRCQYKKILVNEQIMTKKIKKSSGG